MSRNKKIFLSSVFIFGLFVPHIPFLVVFEFFFLIIPFAIIILMSLIYLIVSSINKHMNTKVALFLFLIIPTFILAQFLSSFCVDNFQRLKCDYIISEIEEIKNESGTFPENYDLNAGIEYVYIEKSEQYILMYSIGFMITLKYYSEDKSWKSYGWSG